METIVRGMMGNYGRKDKRGMIITNIYRKFKQNSVGNIIVYIFERLGLVELACKFMYRKANMKIMKEGGGELRRVRSFIIIIS